MNVNILSLFSCRRDQLQLFRIVFFLNWMWHWLIYDECIDIPNYYYTCQNVKTSNGYIIPGFLVKYIFLYTEKSVFLSVERVCSWRLFCLSVTKCTYFPNWWDSRTFVYSYLFSVWILSSKDGEFPRALWLARFSCGKEFRSSSISRSSKGTAPSTKSWDMIRDRVSHSIFIISMGWSEKCSYIIASNTVAWQIYFQSTTILFRPMWKHLWYPNQTLRSTDDSESLTDFFHYIFNYVTSGKKC